MLNVESGPDYIYYRIQRAGGNIVYVKVVDIDTIPEDARTHGRSAIQALRQLPVWDASWTTLVIGKNEQGTWCEIDPMDPHTLRGEDLLEHIPVIDFSSFTTVSEQSFRTSEVSFDGRAAYLKIARFPFEMDWLTQEIRAYHMLSQSTLVPTLLGYVSESRDQNRIIGVLLEKVDGRHARPDDLEVCKQALSKLHDHLIHGDTCRYNIIVTSEGVKFIDLEDSILMGTSRWNTDLRDKEYQDLAGRLADESGRGRPW